MKLFYALSFFPLLISLARAEPKATPEPKGAKKTLVFQPGAKIPDGHLPVSAALPLPAHDVSSPEAPGQFAARFFHLLQKGDVDGAYEGLIRGSKIAERPEESKALKAKTREAIDVFGAVLGYEVVETKNVGEHLLRRTYVSIGKEFPLRWRFYFYKPDATWRLVDLRVDDRLAGIFSEPDEAAAANVKP